MVRNKRQSRNPHTIRAVVGDRLAPGTAAWRWLLGPRPPEQRPQCAPGRGHAPPGMNFEKVLDFEEGLIKKNTGSCPPSAKCPSRGVGWMGYFFHPVFSGLLLAWACFSSFQGCANHRYWKRWRKGKAGKAALGITGGKEIFLFFCSLEKQWISLFPHLLDEENHSFDHRGMIYAVSIHQKFCPSLILISWNIINWRSV